MRWDVICLTFLLGLAGCTKKAVLQRDGVGVRLSEVTWNVPTTSEGVWKVGRIYRDTVSKSLNVVLALPPIEEDDINYLNESFGIDAWLVRIIQSNSQGSRIELITLYAPFRGVQKGRASTQPMKAISFSLTYAAWAISERFRRFQCPAFSHDRRLNDWQLIGEKTHTEFPIAFAGNYSEKLTVSELVPTALNIGNTMVGDYYFEVALFSSSKKQIYSPFVRLPQHVHVSSEKTVSVDGCAGIHSEYDPISPETVPRKK
jgi:hypothetical protein